MTLYFLVKYLHVLGAIVILGTGTGIAFFMLMAHRSREAAFIARTSAVVVIADALFTLSAVLLQPVTGGVLMALSVDRRSASAGSRPRSRSTPSPARSGCPWCSCRSRCAISPAPRPSRAPRCRRATTRCFAAGSCSGIPGFGSVMIILYLMIAKPF